MDDHAWFDANRARVIATRKVAAEALQTLGFEVVPSTANFLFVRHPAHDALTLAVGLRAQRILVRHFAKPRIDQYLRITIGTDDDMAALVSALKSLLL